MNATIKDCSLQRALDRADKKATEIPHIVQVVERDFDTIVMAAEIRRLRALMQSRDKPHGD